MYQTIGYDESELNIYKENGLINVIKSNVVNFTDTELMRNTYKLYYKPFALWTAQC
jgi:hypothetical protein